MDKRLIGAYRAVGGALGAAEYYSMERIQSTDPLTGARIMQLTSYPVLSHTLYFHCPYFTPDSKTIVFMTYNRTGRFATPDAWRVDIDGSNIRPVTNLENLAGFALSPDGATLYFQQGASLLAAPVDGGEAREIGTLPDVDIPATLLGGVTADGAYYISNALMTNGEIALVRYATDGSEAKVLLSTSTVAHMQVDPSGSGRILLGAPGPDSAWGLQIVDLDGTNMRPLRIPQSTGHYAWFGHTGRVVSTVNDPFGSIVTMGENDDEPDLVVKGGHFWHASGSDDGKWIVSDTNWPDLGLILVSAETGVWAPLCRPEASSGHPQWTHPHPEFSPDGRYVVYNSDKTGIGQVYAVEVPDEIREKISG